MPPVSKPSAARSMTSFAIAILYTGLGATIASTGCSDDTEVPSSGSSNQDAGRDTGTEDGDSDVPTGRSDAATNDDATTERDAASTCFVNADCAPDRRCESVDGGEEGTCLPGTRGTGRNGIDPCHDENDCASSLCVEGPDAAFYCSDTCTSDKDCTGSLPRCISHVQVCGR